MTDLPMTKADDDLVEKIRFYVGIRGGPAKDEDGNPIGTAWPMMLEAADAITRLRAQLAAAEAEGKEATKLLLRWSELSGAEDAAAGPDTFAFLGKENSAGWVWAREIQEERDFDAEQNRLRDLAIQCVTTAEERAVAAEAQLQAMRKALERSVTAIDDWLNLYAPEHCDAERVTEARTRVYKFGTLWYISTVQKENREALGSLTEGAGK